MLRLDATLTRADLMALLFAPETPQVWAGNHTFLFQGVTRESGSGKTFILHLKAENGTAVEWFRTVKD